MAKRCDNRRTSATRLAASGALALLLASPFGGGASAAELYAQAIGQPPEREPAPPDVPPPAMPPAPVQAPPPTAEAETPPTDEGLRRRILIGAGIAFALAALGGGGGGGTEAPPASTPATAP